METCDTYMLHLRKFEEITDYSKFSPLNPYSWAYSTLNFIGFQFMEHGPSGPGGMSALRVVGEGGDHETASVQSQSLYMEEGTALGMDCRTRHVTFLTVLVSDLSCNLIYFVVENLSVKYIQQNECLKTC